MNAGERLRVWRQAQGLSEQEAAELLGCHQTTISTLERGRTKQPGIRIALAIERETWRWEPGPIRVDDWPEAPLRNGNGREP